MIFPQVASIPEGTSTATIRDSFASFMASITSRKTPSTFFDNPVPNIESIIKVPGSKWGGFPGNTCWIEIPIRRHIS